MALQTYREVQEQLNADRVAYWTAVAEEHEQSAKRFRERAKVWDQTHHVAERDVLIRRAIEEEEQAHKIRRQLEGKN